MNNSLIVCLFLFVFATTATGQSLQFSAGAGADYGYTYRAQEQPGWPFLRGRHVLPLITQGLNRITASGNIHTLRLLISSESDRLESSDPQIGDAGKTVYYTNGVQYEIMLPLSETGNRHQLFVGYAFSAAPSIFRFSPSSSVYFPRTYRGAMLEAGGCVQYRYPLKNGLSLYSGMTLNIIRTGLEMSRVENPVLTREQQRNTIFEMDLLSGLLVHTGVCANLSPRKQ